ncbi:hypothetical protein Trydic_g12059 [Trypoxylus dichotomus]
MARVLYGTNTDGKWFFLRDLRRLNKNGPQNSPSIIRADVYVSAAVMRPVLLSAVKRFARSRAMSADKEGIFAIKSGRYIGIWSGIICTCATTRPVNNFANATFESH